MPGWRHGIRTRSAAGRIADGAAEAVNLAEREPLLDAFWHQAGPSGTPKAANKPSA
jgi:hypothetical protein